MGRAPNSSSSSSIDSSSSHPSHSTAYSPPPPSSSRSVARRDLSTDLRLGRDYISSASDQLHHDSSNSSEVQPPDWPPIKALLRNTLAERGNNRHRPTFFVKVYMEGIPIGRKLDLFAHHGYDGLIRSLAQMFRTTILFPDIDRLHPDQEQHVLTYEDKEGDWMMVGDVPWEMFLTTVKRLKISRADKI